MKVINNFLDKKIFKERQDFVFSNNFPLYYNNSIVREDVDKGQDFMFNHLFFFDDKQRSDYFNYFMIPILEKLKFKNLLRAKLNCYPRKEKLVRTPLHVDHEFPHKVALFSFNTCNGYTYLEDTKEKVKSVENRMIIFDGLRKHCSVAQTDTDLRINLNINMI